MERGGVNHLWGFQEDAVELVGFVSDIGRIDRLGRGCLLLFFGNAILNGILGKS